MNTTVVETFPPAKLNFFLELLGKRPDGYHELQTVLVAIDRRDALRVARTENIGIELSCDWSPSAAVWRRRMAAAPPETFDLPPAETNLVARALRRFCDVFGCGGGFRVQLMKRIPAGAGMGGASSDAASALLAAAALCGVEPRDPRLVDIAAELGSDIPFFLGPATFSAGDRQRRSEAAESAGASSPRGGKSAVAVAGGRGERLVPLWVVPNLHFVVVYPPEPLSTAGVFGNCRVPTEPRQIEACLEGLRGAGRSGRAGRGETSRVPPMFNRLTEPAREMSVWIDRVLEELRKVGLRGATMTGSGSACFATAGSPRSARRAASILTSRRLGTCFATSPAPLPAIVRTMT